MTPSAHRRDAYFAEVSALRDQVAWLQEELRQANALLRPPLSFPYAWALTGKETLTLASLYRAFPQVRTREALHYAMAKLEVETEPKIVDVYVCKLRKKLRPHGIELQTLHGVGYRLTPAGHRAVAAAIGEDKQTPQFRVAASEGVRHG